MALRTHYEELPPLHAIPKPCAEEERRARLACAHYTLTHGLTNADLRELLDMLGLR